MRVLHWLNTFLPDVGGIQTFCNDLLPAQIERGHEVLLLAAHTSDADADHEWRGPIEVRRVDALRVLFRKNPGGILRAGTRIARIVDEFSPELVHIHPTGPEGVYLRRVLDDRGMPVMATLHNNLGSRGIDVRPGSLFGGAFDRADRIAACSDDARRWLAEARPDLAARLVTIRNAIPAAAPARVAPVRDSSLLITVCRLESQKRLDVLLDAFGVVAAVHADATLRIVGDGSERADLMERARRLGLGARVEFVGRIAPEAVPEALARATMFVMSSDFEGLPIALLEAVRQGLPVVATAVGGIPEAVVRDETGLLVEPGDVAGLAAALLTLLGDPARAQRLGAAAAEHFRTAFAMDGCVDAYEVEYARALEARRAKSGASLAPEASS